MQTLGDQDSSSALALLSGQSPLDRSVAGGKLGVVAQTTDWQRGPAHSTVVSDDFRTSIIAAVYERPGIWDMQREKNGPGRKALFLEITQQVNQQYHHELSCEEVEKQWKNLKDTYNKTKKKMAFDNEGHPIPPKWKFFNQMTFLDNATTSPAVVTDNGAGTSLMYMRARSEDLLGGISPRKRCRETDDESPDDDQYLDFCRSLVHSLRKIGEMDRMKYLALTKNIRDQIYDAEMELLRQSNELMQQQHLMR